MRQKIQCLFNITFLVVLLTACSPGNSFSITWNNWDGSVLAIDNVQKGSMPVYTGSTPVRPSDSQYAYEFSGWNPTPRVVDSNQNYIAKFTSVDVIQSQKTNIINLLKSDGESYMSQYVFFTDGNTIFNNTQGIADYTRFSYDTNTKKFSYYRITGYRDNPSIVTFGRAIFHWGEFKSGTFDGFLTYYAQSGNEYQIDVDFTDMNFGSSISSFDWNEASYYTTFPTYLYNSDEQIGYVADNIRLGGVHLQSILRKKIQSSLVLY